MSKLWLLDINHIHSMDVSLTHLQIPQKPLPGTGVIWHPSLPGHYKTLCGRGSHQTPRLSGGVEETTD